MLRRLSAALVVALVVVPSAAAVRVHVRVEGRTHTIFGTTAPVVNATSNALDALESASNAGEFYYHVQIASFGRYVDRIGRTSATASTGWVFKVNGVSPAVGADAVTLKDGDTVLWYWAQFGVAGGPKTLLLDRAGTQKNCYRVYTEDDNGVSAPAVGAVLHVLPRLMNQLVCTFVVVIARVALDPMPAHRVQVARSFKALPQLLILHRLFRGRAPAVALPVVDVFRDPVAHILAVGVHVDDARSGQRLQP